MKKLKLYALLTAIAASICPSQAQIINTIAGNGVAGSTGDGGAATAAKLNYPRATAVDAAGNVYITDGHNNKVRKISPTGVITTFAGTGTAAFSGDGGQATAAALSNPTDMAIDAAGNVYISDWTNHRIRKVDAAGIISTVAGNGVGAFAGDGGQATAASLNYPAGLAFDAAGNLYIADSYNHSVRKVITSTGIISTIAGTGTSTGMYSGATGPATTVNLLHPNFLYIDAADNVFIRSADNTIRKVNTAGIISNIVGNGTYAFSGDGGPATAATLAWPGGMTMDAAGNLYIADAGNQRIRKIGPGDTISTFAGTGATGFGGDGGPAIAATFNLPADVQFDINGNLLIPEIDNNRVRGIPFVTNFPVVFSNESISFSICGGATKALDTVLSVADTNVGQVESWSVILTPLHGTLGGFTTTATSTGSVTLPTGVSYTATTGYTGTDSFKIKVFDGYAWDVITATVTINPVLSAGTITGITAICSELPTTLSSTEPGGTWSSGSPTIAVVSSSGIVSGISPGTAIISYNVSNSCGSDVATITVTVSTPPSVAPITGIDSVCPGRTITLADASAGGTWSSSDVTIATVSISGVVTGVLSGYDTIRYTITNVCGSATAVYPIKVLNANACDLSIVEMNDNGSGGLYISPNPNNGCFAVTMRTATQGVVYLTITNVVGQKVYECSTEANKEKYMGPQLTPGMYLLSASNAKERYLQKIIVE